MLQKTSKTPTRVPIVLVSAALIALQFGLSSSAHISVNLVPPKLETEDSSSTNSDNPVLEISASESQAKSLETEMKPPAVNYAKVPRLQNSKIPSKQDLQNSKFAYKTEDKNDENTVPDPSLTLGGGGGGEKEGKIQPMSEDELVFQWRALKLNKNGNKQKLPIASNDQEAEPEVAAAVSEEDLDEHVPGGKDLVVYNTLASVRGADRRAQGASDGDGGDLQQKKGPFFRG